MAGLAGRARRKSLRHNNLGQKLFFFKILLDKPDNRCIMIGVMVDDTNFDKEFIMQKFSFRVDIVNDGHVDTASVIDAISGVVDGEGKHFAVVFTGDETLSDQGLKVWAKRVAGISLAAPKTKKAKPAVAAETAETVA